jgi:hypothetical protein
VDRFPHEQLGFVAICTALVWSGCTPAPDSFAPMESYARSAETFLASNDNEGSRHWQEFRASFPGAQIAYSIHESARNPVKLVWAKATDETNGVAVALAIPLYFDGNSWTNRGSRFTAAVEDNARAWQIDFKYPAWDQWRSNGFSREFAEGLRSK